VYDLHARGSQGQRRRARPRITPPNDLDRDAIAPHDRNKRETIVLNRLIFLAAGISAIAASPAAAADPAFAAHPSPLYAGKAVQPAFKGAQRPYAAYRTRIRQSVAAGVGFGGHYALAVIGCGTGCRFGYITDLKTGIVHDLPVGGEDYRTLLYRARPDSRLLQTQWERHDKDGAFTGCALQDFVWNGKAFAPLGPRRNTSDECPNWDEPA